jgi:phosphoserine aminotransferase
VITIQAEPTQVQQLKDTARKEGITLGNGYGVWKQNTFRIANFPAIDPGEIEVLKNLLRS